MKPLGMSPADRSRALMDLQLRLANGESTDECVAFLVSRGFPPAEARAKIDALISESRRADRRKGLVWLACAGVCFLLATPMILGVADGVEHGHATRGFLTALAHAGALPGLLVLAGVLVGARALVLLVRRGYSASPD